MDNDDIIDGLETAQRRYVRSNSEILRLLGVPDDLILRTYEARLELSAMDDPELVLYVRPTTDLGSSAPTCGFKVVPLWPVDGTSKGKGLMDDDGGAE